MTCDVMIDIEALGRAPSGAIVSIGAFAFDLNDENVAGPEFSLNVDPIDAQRCGMTLDADTVRWWINQERDAQEAWQHEPKALWAALRALNHWLGCLPVKPSIWANGPSFASMVLWESISLCSLCLRVAA